MKTVETHTMPAHWASALLSGDWSYLKLTSLQEIQLYMIANPDYSCPVSCGEEITLERFTFYPGNTLLTECLVYSFLRGE